jgi:hypothetical protein
MISNHSNAMSLLATLGEQLEQGKLHKQDTLES